MMQVLRSEPCHRSKIGCFSKILNINKLQFSKNAPSYCLTGFWIHLWMPKSVFSHIWKKMYLGEKEGMWWQHTKLLLLHQDCNRRKYSNSTIIQIKTSNIGNLKDFEVLQSCVIQSYLVYVLSITWPFYWVKSISKSEK